MKKHSFDWPGLRTSLPFDFKSGLIVFLVALPLCLGIAVACKTPVMSGLIAGAVGGIVIGFLGGSQLGVSGPAAGLVAVILSAQGTLGGFEGVLLATVLAGVIQVLLGLARFGSIASYFPNSVIKGMLAAIGVIIILKFLPHALGDDLDYVGDMAFIQNDGHTTLSEFLYMASQIQPESVIITLLGLGLLILADLPSLRKTAFFKTIPAPLLVVVMGIGVQLALAEFYPAWALSADHLVHIDLNPTTKAADGTVVASPFFQTPNFSLILDWNVWVVALVIAGVASVESLLCAEATDKLDPEKRITPMNRELWAQGVGNIVSGMIGGLPITQVIVRSSANIQAGAKTRLSAVIHGLLLVLAVGTIPGILNLIPYASLAAILIVVGYKLAKPALFVLMWKKGLAQFVPFAVTIVAILLTDLLKGIGIGMVVGVVSILYSNFRVPYFFRIVRQPDGGQEICIELSEVVSFLNKGHILSTLRAIPDGSRVILDATRSTSIDHDVKELIEDFIQGAAKRRITVTYIQKDHSLANPFPRQQEVLKQLDALQTTDQ
jgi:MFS superfamily sulfate permease-like transporter